MNTVNKTLYIPLYGKAYVSRRGIVLHDPKAEEIWAAEGFALKGKSRSKWLAYYMGIRAAVFDRWLKDQTDTDPGAVVLHIGCGMDSRAARTGSGTQQWFDVDFPEVIAERKRYYRETDAYHMIGSDIRDARWLGSIPRGSRAVIVMEGVSMYLTREELKAVLRQWKAYFSEVHILMDCYTEFAARASKYKNPIRDVGVTQVYGLDDPRALTEGTGLTFIKEHEMTPDALVNALRGTERILFKTLYAGKMAQRLYKLYEYR